MLKVLNVGGGAGRDLPPLYKGWKQSLLDIDPDVHPDIVCDAKDMGKLKPAMFDAVYTSHCLEHFYQHDVPKVLSGFLRVLKPSGFAHIIVPDIGTLIEEMAKGCRDIGDVWYRVSGNAPVTFHDVLYGWGMVMKAGNEFYSHKTGFSQKSITKAIRASGFKTVRTAIDGLGNLFAFAFKSAPTKEQMRALRCL